MSIKYLVIGMKTVAVPNTYKDYTGYERRVVAWSGPKTKVWQEYMRAIGEIQPKVPTDVLFQGATPTWAGKPYGYSSRRHAIQAAVHLYEKSGQATVKAVTDLEVWPMYLRPDGSMIVDGNPVSVPSQREGYNATN